MFEFEQFDGAAIARATHPSLDPETERRSGPDRIRSHSVMNWGEHCTECSPPSCYRTCSFYQPRPDGRCRRFTFGIYRAPSPRSWMGYSAYVEFKNWSQLGTQGNATQLPAILTVLLQCAGAIAWTLSAPLDRLLQRATGRKRVSVALQWLRRRIIRGAGRLYPHFPRPDVLLIEVFNPMSADAQLQLRVTGSGRVGRFEWSARVSPGFSSFPIPVASLETGIDLSAPFEMNLTVQEEEGKALYFCSASFVRLAAKPVAAATNVPASGPRRIKCVVWDLDHTLWDGILVESGAGVPALKEGIRDVLNELDRRGILLSITSKNSEDDARSVLESLGLWELFLAPQINWQPKSEGVRRIAERLNIGLDTLAVVDDMPFERDEIASALPAVSLIPAEEYLSMLARPEFAGDASSDGASRRSMYRTEMNRTQAMAESNASYDTFLATCGIRVSIERPGEELLPRIEDIVQRTNQLNIASQRYTLDELRGLIHGSECDCYIASCSDNYGSYGYVGFIVVARSRHAVVIRDCMFSCRIQGKRIDEAVLAHIVNQYLLDGITSVQARFIPTKRNAPAGEMLQRLGFSQERGVEQVLAIVPASPRSTVDHVRVESTLMAKSCSLY